MVAGPFQSVNSTPLNLLLFHPFAVLRFILRQMGQKLNKRRMHVKTKGPRPTRALLVSGQAKRCISVRCNQRGKQLIKIVF
jgi:hypothetical protein